MISFEPLSKHNNWDYQPGFYLHGTIQSNFDTDLVTMSDETYKDRVSEFYKEGQALPPTFIDIPEGLHLCEVRNIPCVLYTWKVINICKDGWYYSATWQGKFDIHLRQIGLIVALSDKEHIKDAKEKYEKRTYIV